MNTKPKMLFLYGASRLVALPIAKALEKFFEVDTAYVASFEDFLSFDVDLPTLKTVKLDQVDISQYNVCLGLDPSALKFLIKIKKHFRIPVGCTILDVPFHVFEHTRNHHPSLEHRWALWFKEFKQMDFIVSWREYTESIFRIPHLALFAPVDPPKDLNLSAPPLRQICYSGSVRPDKGVHNLIESISIISNIPSLVVIGQGYDLSNFAEYLKVPYRQIKCSQKEKFEIYNQSVVVAYPDHDWIPPLCPIEAISIGKIPIVTDCREARRLYGDHATYVPKHNTGLLAEAIEFRLDNLEDDTEKSNAIEFWKQNRTNDIYAQQLYDFIARNISL